MTDGKIVSLREGFNINPPGAIPEVVEYIEELLQEARDGRVIAVAVIKVCDDMQAYTQWRYGGGTHESNALMAGCVDMVWIMGKQRKNEED
jgi:hypothetical protein